MCTRSCTHVRKSNQRTSITTENQPDTVNNKARDDVRTTHEQKDHFKYKTCHPKSTKSPLFIATSEQRIWGGAAMEKSHVQVHGGVKTEKVAGTFLIQLFLRLLFWKRKKSTRRLCLQLRKRLEANKTNLIPSHKRTKIPILCGKSTRRSLSTNNKRHVKQRFASFNTRMVGKRISLNWGLGLDRGESYFFPFSFHLGFPPAA